MSFCKSAADIILVCVPDGAEDGLFVVVCCSFAGVVDFTSWLAISDCRTTTRCMFATDEGLLLGVRIEGVSSLWVGPKNCSIYYTVIGSQATDNNFYSQVYYM